MTIDEGDVTMVSETKWPTYDELPSIKNMPDCTVDRYGRKIASVEQWEEQRAYLKEMFAHYMYGHAPKERGKITANITEKGLLFGGQAVEEWLTLSFGVAGTVSMQVRFLYPNTPGKRFPLIIRSADNLKEPIPLEEKAVTEYGFALAAFNRNNLCGDRTLLEMVVKLRDGTLETNPTTFAAVQRMDKITPAKIDFDNIHPLAAAYPGYDWGEVAQWGFGYLICMDYFETLPQVDTKKICYTGHSRLGKAALWAGLYDERAAVVTPNGSGCGGVGSLRFIGTREGLCQDPEKCEAVGGIMNFAPEWWCPEFGNFGDNSVYPERERRLPFDANTLRAAIAPRACFTTEGLGDYWSNPCGTQYAWEDAQPLFDLLGISEKNGIHFREGGHAHNEEDWQALLTYCNFLWFGKPLTGDINKKYFKR